MSLLNKTQKIASLNIQQLLQKVYGSSVLESAHPNTHLQNDLEPLLRLRANLNELEHLSVRTQFLMSEIQTLVKK